MTVHIQGQKKKIFISLCAQLQQSASPKGEFSVRKKWQIKSLRSMIYSYGRCQSRACCDLVYWLPDQIIQASINLPPHQRYSQTGKTTSISDHIKSCRSISKFSILGLKELANFTQRIFRFQTFISQVFLGYQIRKGFGLPPPPPPKGPFLAQNGQKWSI